MKTMYFISLLFAALLLVNCEKENSEPEGDPEKDSLPNDTLPPPITGPIDVEKTNAMKIYVHYMPWFETPETNQNQSWGIHWAMANQNPNNTDSEGKQEIASHYYPLIGPYASSDKDAIEYHLLLMKYSGIDGLIIDWYGSTDKNDFGMNRRNTEAVIDKLDDVGLQFALTYEDWTTNGSIDAAIDDFVYMDDNYFNLESYININDKPLLTVFGPQTITTEDDWSSVLANISNDLTYLSLWYESSELGSNGSGEFGWVYEDNSHQKNFITNRMNQVDIGIGSAYPGFVDFYEEGGWNGSALPWEIPHDNGATLEATLKVAGDKNIDYLQLVTWNDFGEGTIIEPTLEFEYQYLEIIQTFTGVTYTKTEFEYITELYNLRKSKANDNAVQQELDKAFDYFVSLQVNEAKNIIDSIQ